MHKKIGILKANELTQNNLLMKGIEGLHPVSFRLWMAFGIILTHPRKPAPCFLCTFFWFHILMVTESDLPIYLLLDDSNQIISFPIKDQKRLTDRSVYSILDSMYPSRPQSSDTDPNRQHLSYKRGRVGLNTM